MRKPEQTPEPSIEEILASIRKIIADDGTQGRRASGGSDFPRQVPNTQPSVHSFESLRPARPDHQRSPQGSSPELDDEILELTEDFMLGEQAAQDAHQGEIEGVGVAVSGGIAPEYSSAIEDDIDDRGLESVFSNVAAEVERLAAGDRGRGTHSAPFYEDTKRAAPAAPDQSGHSTGHSVPTNMSEAAGQSEPAVAPPQPSAPTPPAERPRMHSRQLWSARRLEGEGGQPGHRVAAASAEPQEAGSSAQQGGNKSRDRWAEGVQMPVPETGPTMPFPYASEDEPNVSYSALADENHEPEVGAEDEKRFVGDFLTRVFGGSPQQNEESSPSVPGLKGKAEDLAKAAVSDFASDKLGAPAVASAFHADRPFMDQITDSLESALARAEAVDDDEIDAEESVADQLAHDELPEVPPPPDAEFAPFGGVGDEASAMPASEQSPRSAPSGLPISDTAAAGLDLAASHPDALFGDARPSREAHHSDQALAASALARQENPVSAPASGDARIKSDMPAVGGNALPDGLEESIREMIKPLIMLWLNDNLARIVEQAVREELAERRGDVPDLRTRGGGQR